MNLEDLRQMVSEIHLPSGFTTEVLEINPSQGRIKLFRNGVQRVETTLMYDALGRRPFKSAKNEIHYILKRHIERMGYDMPNFRREYPMTPEDCFSAQDIRTQLMNSSELLPLDKIKIMQATNDELPEILKKIEARKLFDPKVLSKFAQNTLPIHTEEVYDPKNTYYIGIDPAIYNGEQIGKAAFCIYNKTKDKFVAMYSSPRKDEFEKELEKVIAFYNIAVDKQIR